MNKIFQDILEKQLPILTQEQVSPFGKESDIDFIEQDETDYYAMKNAIDDDKNTI